MRSPDHSRLPLLLQMTTSYRDVIRCFFYGDYCIFTLLFLEITNILITFALANQTPKHYDSNTTQGGIDP